MAAQPPFLPPSSGSSHTRQTSGMSITAEPAGVVVPRSSSPVQPGPSLEPLSQPSHPPALPFDHAENKDMFPPLRAQKGRRMSLPQGPSTSSGRRHSSAFETSEVVSRLYTGTLPKNFFEDMQLAKSYQHGKRERRQSVAVPTYAYLSKDFNKDKDSLIPVNPEDSGPSSKRRGVNVELRLQEAKWRQKRRMSNVAQKARDHFKKVEEVKLNTSEADEKEMHRIEAATRKIYK